MHPLRDPEIIVLALLFYVGAILWVIAAVLVLVDGRYPDSLWRFLLGIVRWEGCLLAYLASVADRYPPFTLETGRWLLQLRQVRRKPMIGSVTSSGCDLYYEEQGEGVPILLIHPAGSTASTWGAATAELARIGRVVTYDRRGYARSGGEPVRVVSTHTADAAAILESLATAPAVVVGTSAGAAIAVDLAVRRPDLVRVVIAHDFHGGSLVTSLPARRSRLWPGSDRWRQSDAAEALLRSAYTYRDGGSAWDAFPEQWRQADRENARAALADFRNSIREYPSAADLASVEVPVVCTYGERSPRWMSALVRSPAAAIPSGSTQQIEGSGHAAPFDATANFVQPIAGTIASKLALAAHGSPPSRRHCRRARRRGHP